MSIVLLKPRKLLHDHIAVYDNFQKPLLINQVCVLTMLSVFTNLTGYPILRMKCHSTIS